MPTSEKQKAKTLNRTCPASTVADLTWDEFIRRERIELKSILLIIQLAVSADTTTGCFLNGMPQMMTTKWGADQANGASGANVGTIGSFSWPYH
jgi:hypothetical protein